MKKAILFLTVVFLAATAAKTSLAQDPGARAPVTVDTALEPEQIPGGMEGFISLDLRSIDVIEALKFLSVKAGLDVVTTKNVSGRVTLMVEDVPVKDVFDIMLRSNKLAYDVTGKIYNVMTEDEYKALYGKPFADTREVTTFRLRYIIPEQAFSLFDAMRSEIGRVLVDPESGNALVIDIPEKIREMNQALEAFERKNEIRIFPLEYAKAKDVEDQLKNQLDGKKVGMIKADDRANQVIVQTLPDRMEEIERLIKELDAKTREVIIETSIIKVKFTDSRVTGVSWEGLNSIFTNSNTLIYAGSTPFTTVNPVTSAGTFTSRVSTYQTQGGVGSYPFSGTTSSLNTSVPDVGTESLNLGIVSNKRDLNMVLQYIQTLGSTKILANPKIVVTNNQESRIHVGEKQAYVTTTTTTGQVTNTVAENVTFVDVGTQIAITPAINKDGFVTMKVKAEISSVTSTLTTPSQNKIPIIDTSLAETTVMVKEGSTVILGGLRRDERVDSTKKTPFLGSLPWIGNMFKNATNSVDHTELMILLTPKVITGDALVTESGQKVERLGIKERQEYGALKLYQKKESVEAMRSAGAAQIKPEFKGMKGTI